MNYDYLTLVAFHDCLICSSDPQTGFFFSFLGCSIKSTVAVDEKSEVSKLYE